MNELIQIHVRTFYLQMIAAPDRQPKAYPPELTFVRAVRPYPSFYRFIFKTIGEPWGWLSRLIIPEKELLAIIHDPLVEVYVAYWEGVPVGIVELDRREKEEVELGFFGLINEMTGKGLGPFLIDFAIQKAWSYRPKRFWLHTCVNDHPKALDFYKKAGFELYDEQMIYEPVPRDFVRGEVKNI
jgi:GNAT superfamily N-acetyltransferase